MTDVAHRVLDHGWTARVMRTVRCGFHDVSVLDEPGQDRVARPTRKSRQSGPANQRKVKNCADSIRGLIRATVASRSESYSRAAVDHAAVERRPRVDRPPAVDRPPRPKQRI